MATLKLIFNIAYADFLERARRYSLLIIIGITVFAGIASIPDSSSKTGIMCFSGYRGLYNTAWVAYGIALTTSIIISLFGFYLVKNTIDRDNRTGVGQIIASTSVSNLEYCSGKMLSNIFLLSIISLVMMLMALIMQQVRGEETFISLYNLITPFILLTLPTIIFISALAVYFETIDYLKYGLGNILYLFIWLLLITAIASGQSIFDLTGGSIVISHITNDILDFYPDYNGGYTLIGSVNINKIFYWYGVEWSFLEVVSRIFWIFISVIIVYQASKTFKRFSDNSPQKLIKMSDNNLMQLEKNNDDKTFIHELSTPINKKFHFGQLVIYESFTILKGQNFFWYIAILVLTLLSFVIKIDIAREVILPAVFLTISLMCSKASSKEVIYKTEQLILHTPKFDRYQILAEFIAIILIFVLSSIGMIIRFAIFGMWISILSLLVASSLISSILLLLGILSKDSKLFEVLFIITWYIGLFQKTYPIDFLNLTGVHNTIGYLSVLIAISVLLLFAAFFIRKGTRNFI